MINKKEVVLSGIRATGKLHLGNYLGAIRYFVELSNDPNKKCFFFIANLHTLTTRIDPAAIQRDLNEIVLTYLACGINVDNSTIFAQSSVPETCELTWLLMCLSTVNELIRMPHFKDKKKNIEKSNQYVNAGLLTYPVLMAADILGPLATLVPVGEDQKPHVEIAKALAQKFNNAFGKLFSEPKTLEHDIRVPGLDGTGKMGKSDGNTIDIFDPPNIVWSKLKSAVTDPQRIRRNDSGNPNICNIYTLHTLVSSAEEIKEVYHGCASANIGCIDCKHILENNINAILAPIQERRLEISSQKDNIANDILYSGGRNARQVIAQTVNEAKERMGVPSY